MSGLSVSQTLREDFLTCKVCLCIFDAPKILPCFHTYCRKCISQLIERAHSDTFHCPECRRSAIAQNKDPDSFQTNFYVTGLVEAFTVDRCSVCQLRGTNKSASHQCLDCGDSLCESCSVGHLASRSTVTHRVVTLEDVASGKYDQEIKNKRQVFCEEHRDKECSFYCKSCKKAICVHCALLVHRDHQLSSVEEGTSEAQGNASSILQKSQDILKELGTMWTNVQSRIKDMQERQQATMSELEVACEQLVQVVIAQKEDALTKLQESYDAELAEYAALKQEIDAAGKSGRKMVDSVQVIVSNEIGTQMLLLNDTLKQGLVQLEDSYETLSQKSIPESQVAFAINTMIYQSPIFTIYRVGESTDVGLSRVGDQHLGGYVGGYSASNGALDRNTSLMLSTPDLSMNEPLKAEKKFVSVSSGNLVQSLQPVLSEPLQRDVHTDHTAKLKHTLQNYRILDPPTALVKPAQSMQKPPSPPVPVSITDPASRSYSDVLKHPATTCVVSGSQSIKAPKFALNLKLKLDLSVKKDSAVPEIKGLAFFGHDRILVTDTANGKVKSFPKDGLGTCAFVKEFRENEFTPSSVASIKDVIAFTLQNAVYIVTKQYVPIARVPLKSSAATVENMQVCTFPLCWYDEESFLVSNLHGNKQWVLRVSGEFLRELQCPARSPVVAVSRDSSLRYYFSSWGQPGSVVVADANLKRLMVLQPVSGGKSLEEWYPAYSACDNAGNIYVADPYSHEIVVFNQSGRHVFSYNTRADDLLQPVGLIIDKKDMMYVTGQSKEAFVYKIKRKKVSK